MAKGRVVEGNFDTYPVMRMRRSPPIEVHIIESEADPGRVGEPGTSAPSPRWRMRSPPPPAARAFTLPLDPNQLKQA